MVKIYKLIVIFAILLLIEIIIIKYLIAENNYLFDLDYKNINSNTLLKIITLKEKYSLCFLVIIVSNFLLFLQTFCIPGSFVFNIMTGAIFGVKIGFIISLLCNTIGSYFCYLLSDNYLKEYIAYNNYLRNKLLDFTEKKDNVLKELKYFNLKNILMVSSFRLFPITPGWLMNILFPHLNINKYNFILGILIGNSPLNYIICKSGSLLVTNNIKNFNNIFLLSILAIILFSISILLNKNKQKIN